MLPADVARNVSRPRQYVTVCRVDGEPEARNRAIEQRRDVRHVHEAALDRQPDDAGPERFEAHRVRGRVWQVFTIESSSKTTASGSDVDTTT